MNIQELKNQRQKWLEWKNIKPLREKLQNLPILDEISVDFGDIINLHVKSISEDKRCQIYELAKSLKPWRKGPYDVFETFIDSEWQSFKKYNLLEPYFDFDTSYVGLGIDRVAACYIIEDGLVVDAGSAITLDIMSANVHLGGFILPGISAQLNTLRQISSRLSVSLRSSIDLNMLPQDTNTAASYGIISSIVLLIEHNHKGKKIYFTGGDGPYLSRYFPESIYNKALIFDGLKKVIQENKL